MNFDIITALVTPLKENKNIDIDSFINLIQYQCDNNINCFVLFGTTGEGSLIPLKDKICAYKKIRSKFKKVKIYIGISKMSSVLVTKEMKKWNKLDIDGYLILTPHYINTNNRGIFKFYKNINNISTKDIYIYHVKKRTGQELDENIIEDLKTLSHVKGIKYAMDFQEVKKINNLNKGNDFKLYLGNDDQLIDGLKESISGCVSVFSNAFPCVVNKIVSLFKENKIDDAVTIFNKNKELINLLFKEPNPLGIKYLLFLKGLINEVYLDPLFGLSFETKALLNKAYKELENEN